MSFDRYKILIAKYTNEIEAWGWDKIKANAYENCVADRDSETVCGKAWLGTPLGLYPSGKIYAFWTSNQTKADMIKDQCFVEALDKAAQDNGMFIDHNDEGDFLACVVIDEDTQVRRYVTDEDQELGESLLNCDKTINS